jgi:regulatory protein
MLKRQLTLRERAIGLLARREHSRAELARKLSSHAEDPHELEQLLDALAATKRLSDERYAEVRVHSLERKFGGARIVHELKSKGVAPELAERMAAMTAGSEVERAREAYKRKFRSPPASREERARHGRFLQSRGFSFDTIRAVLKGEESEG